MLQAEYFRSCHFLAQNPPKSSFINKKFQRFLITVDQTLPGLALGCSLTSLFQHLAPSASVLLYSLLPLKPRCACSHVRVTAFTVSSAWNPVLSPSLPLYVPGLFLHFSTQMPPPWPSHLKSFPPQSAWVGSVSLASDSCFWLRS